MTADPEKEFSEGLKHCLWFRGPALMDHLITLRNEAKKRCDESGHTEARNTDQQTQDR